MISESNIPKREFHLENFIRITAKGNDVIPFLNGQLTNNLEALAVGKTQITCRLNLKGRVQSIIHLAKISDKEAELIIESTSGSEFLKEIEKFIIMEDVVLTQIEGPIYISEGFSVISEGKPVYFFNGLPAIISDFPSKSPGRNQQRLYYGIPQWKNEIDESKFLNESFLNEIAIDYKKGCFFGQETVAKINSGRGGATYSCLLKTDDLIEITSETAIYIDDDKAGSVVRGFSYESQNFLFCYLKRVFRVNGSIHTITLNNNSYSAQTILFRTKFIEFEWISSELFLLGARLFNHESNHETAKECFELAIKYDRMNLDAYESLGVLLGREEKYSEAISLMEQLAELDENSIMARTNLSLFHMKIGNIEEAENQKAKSTLLSMKQAAADARQKKSAKEHEEAQRKDIERRRNMFLKVLELDENDALANYGLADIAFTEGNYEFAKSSLIKVLDADEKYSVAYLLLGKTFEKLNEENKATEVYLKGVKIAAAKGDMMPANEMQTRLNQIQSN